MGRGSMSSFSDADGTRCRMPHDHFRSSTKLLGISREGTEVHKVQKQRKRVFFYLSSSLLFANSYVARFHHDRHQVDHHVMGAHKAASWMLNNYRYAINSPCLIPQQCPTMEGYTGLFPDKRLSQDNERKKRRGSSQPSTRSLSSLTPYLALNFLHSLQPKLRLSGSRPVLLLAGIGHLIALNSG